MNPIKDKVLDVLTGVRAATNWGLVAVDTVFWGGAVIVMFPWDRGGRKAYHLGTSWSKFNLWAVGGRLTVEGDEKVEPGKPYVIMTNHQSYLDIWSVYAAVPSQIRWVMKQELRKVPVFGLTCDRMGHIYVQRGNSESARASMREAGRKIRAGVSVVFFPEGTRSTNGRMLPFKSGGFRLAIEAGVPILPVSINGTREMLPSGTWRQKPGRIHVHIGDPIPTEGLTPDNLDDLMSRTRRAMEEGLQA